MPHAAFTYFCDWVDKIMNRIMPNLMARHLRRASAENDRRYEIDCLRLAHSTRDPDYLAHYRQIKMLNDMTGVWDNESRPVGVWDTDDAN